MKAPRFQYLGASAFSASGRAPGWAPARHFVVMPPTEIAATLANLPLVLRTLLAPCDDAVLRERPAPGEWSVVEIIVHLIATDSGAFRDRIASIVAGEPTIGGFDPWAAINERDVASITLDTLLDELIVERATSVALLHGLSADDLTKTAVLEPHGTFTAGDFVYEWPFHDQDHLRQILANLQQQYLPHMGELMQNALTGNR